jgi:hypothetical protein
MDGATPLVGSVSRPRRRLPPSVVFAVLGGFVVLLLLGCVLIFPRYLVNRDLGTAPAPHLTPDARLKATNDVRTTLLQGLVGAFFLATAFFTWRQLRISQRQLQLSEEQQIADRFARAVEQLGKKELDVRLGGVFALEQIAKSSSVYCDLVAEVLSAYVRGHAPQAPLPARRAAGPVSPDLQAAVTALGRTIGPQPRGGNAINLCDVVLAGADLRGAVLPGVRLNGSNLSNAHLEGAHLEGARLVGTNLTGAWLNGAWLSGEAKLIRAALEGARLIGTDLTGADLTSATVDEHTRLIKTRLDGAKLRHVALDRTRYGQLSWNEETEWPEGFVLRAEAGDIPAAVQGRT